MTTVFAEFVVAICLLGITYSYFFYVLLVWCAAKCFGRQPTIPMASATKLPTVSLLIAAFNEESVIGERIRNALAMDYPPEKLEIVIASDGSTDGTCKIVRQLQCRFARIRLLDFSERRGKAAVLNDAIGHLAGEIVMFSDANTFTDSGAARKLARWFGNSEVGAVCGRLIITDPATGRNADGLYWRYETFIKKCEAQLGSLLGANGAVYAIRRSEFVPLPPGSLVDDFLIPLLIKMQTGKATVYDSQAIAEEESASNVAGEFRRRVRIGAGGFHSIGVLWTLLNPHYGWTAVSFFSHKVLRWFCPFLMIGLVLANIVLLASPGFQLLFVLQLCFYALSITMALLPEGIKMLRPLRLTTMFTSMNLALLFGFFRWLRGNQTGTWTRTARLAETQYPVTAEKLAA